MTAWLRLGLLLLLVLPGRLLGSDAPLPIKAIEFEGNDTTRAVVMLNEMVIQRGDPLDYEAVEISRQAIRDLGLFRTVEAEVIEEPDGAIVRMVVDEKFYILPIPRLDADLETLTYRYGLDVQFDNLLGLNRKLNLQLEYRSPEDEIEARRDLSAAYVDPLYNRGRDRLSVSLGTQERDLRFNNGGDDDSRYAHRRHRVGVSLGRALENDVPGTQGWRRVVGLDWQFRDYDLESGPAREEAVGGTSFSLGVGMEYVRVSDFGTYRSGRDVSYGIQQALPGGLSDFSFTRASVTYRRYLPLSERENLNWQGWFGVAGGSAFGSPAFSVGGGRSLRGHPSDAAEGNAVLQSNLEYLRQFWGRYPPLRGVLFLDLANAYEDVRAIRPWHLKSGVGAGLRWQVQAFVDITLRGDLGYDIDGDNLEFYFTTRAAF